MYEGNLEASESEAADVFFLETNEADEAVLGGILRLLPSEFRLLRAWVGVETGVKLGEPNEFLFAPLLVGVEIGVKLKELPNEFLFMIFVGVAGVAGEDLGVVTNAPPTLVVAVVFAVVAVGVGAKR